MLPGPTLPALHGQALAVASRRRGGLYAGRNQRSRHSATVVWASDLPAESVLLMAALVERSGRILIVRF
jgi:hypothetical protein